MRNLIIGTIGGILISAIVINFSDNTTRQVNEMVKECEKSLPRNDHCYIIAVPPDKD
jgi:galactitol-specific phosphotransferase system IIC component